MADGDPLHAARHPADPDVPTQTLPYRRRLGALRRALAGADLQPALPGDRAPAYPEPSLRHPRQASIRLGNHRVPGPFSVPDLGAEARTAVAPVLRLGVVGAR